MAVQAYATAKYIRTSAQKAGLVMDLIRGRDVNTRSAYFAANRLPIPERPAFMMGGCGRWTADGSFSAPRMW